MGCRQLKKTDELAKNRPRTPFVGPKPLCGIQSNAIKRVLREKKLSKWIRGIGQNSQILVRIAGHVTKAILGDLNWKWYKYKATSNS